MTCFMKSWTENCIIDKSCCCLIIFSLSKGLCGPGLEKCLPERSSYSQKDHKVGWCPHHSTSAEARRRPLTASPCIACHPKIKLCVSGQFAAKSTTLNSSNQAMTTMSEWIFVDTAVIDNFQGQKSLLHWIACCLEMWGHRNCYDWLKLWCLHHFFSCCWSVQQWPHSVASKLYLKWHELHSC